MLTKEERQMIIEYWSRTLLSPSFSIADITKIMIEFGDQYEIFDNTAIAEKLIKISDDGTIASAEGTCM